MLTIKCSQLEQANEAWSLHYKTQTENMVQVIQSALSLDETVTFDGLPQHIINHVDDGKRDFQEKYNRLEDSLRQQQSGNKNSLLNRTNSKPFWNVYLRINRSYRNNKRIV